MFDVDVNHMGRSYTVTFASNAPGSRALNVQRLNAGGQKSRVDLFDVTGLAVVRLARGKVAKNAG